MNQKNHKIHKPEIIFNKHCKGREKEQFYTFNRIKEEIVCTLRIIPVSKSDENYNKNKINI